MTYLLIAMSAAELYQPELHYLVFGYMTDDQWT